MSNEPEASPTAEELVDQVARAGLTMTWRLAQQVVACGSAAVPLLVSLMTREGAWEDTRSEATEYAPLHAFHLLGAIGDAAAAPELLDALFEQDLGDFTNETAVGVLAALGPAALPTLIAALTQRPTDNDYARAAVASALVDIGREHPEHRPAIATVFAQLLGAERDAHFLALLADDAAVIDSPEVEAALDDAFAKSRVETFLVNHEEVASLRTRRTPWDRGRPQDTPREYFAFIERLARQRASVRKAPAPVASAPRPSVPKVGRNDPCPCGSGRKYKKCHGA